MSKPFVAVLMGSDSDLPLMQAARETLEALQIHSEWKITSAHRTPDVTHAYIEDAERRGCAVFIAAAGLAAHLAGAVAARSIKPVIGVPLDVGPLQGIDSLLSTVQMPSGIPVATVAIGATGAKNAAYLAAQILAIADKDLAARLRQDRITSAEKVMAKDAALQASCRT